MRVMLINSRRLPLSLIMTSADWTVCRIFTDPLVFPVIKWRAVNADYR
jgi:hypothetical protein